MKYIGIDIGDGESAVAVLTDDSVIEPVIQPIGGRGSILSVVGMSGNDVLIGERALLDRKIGHLRSRFKRRFLSTLDAERDIERFAHGLLLALANESASFFEGDVCIAVGCPAGWKQHDRLRYQEIMSKAGFDNVSVVSESRAAFFYARYAHELKVAPELLKQTTLVIDIGSSTTDFAYIVDGRESSIGTFGDVSLGGGLIEAYMLKRAVEKSPKRDALEDTFAESLSWKNRCEIAARRLKEQYFLNEDEWKDTPCVASETVYYDEPVKLRFAINEDEMREILATPMEELLGATFMECLNDLLRHAAAATQANPPKLIILTGGASRMRFFREACARTFPGAQTVVCPNPEYSIAKGLAYAARIDDKLRAFNADIQAYFDSGEISGYIKESMEWLTVPLAGILSGQIINDVVLPVLNDWKAGELLAIDDMEAPIIERSDKLLKNLNAIPSVQPAVNSWCLKLFARIQPRLDEICRAHDVDRAGMSLSGISGLEGPERMDIMLGSPIASTLVYALTGALSASLCGGGGLTLISAGPLGIVIGALIGIVVAYFGKMVVVNSVCKANLPMLSRKMLCLSFKRSLASSRQRKVIEKELYESMHKDDFAKRLETDVLINLEKQIMDMARSVEMPLIH